MDKQLIAEKAAAQFNTAQGSNVDVIFATSDGNLFYEYEKAMSAASKLADKAVLPFYKDDEVREMAKTYKELNKMVFVTDHLKLQRLKNVNSNPAYKDYVEYADAMGMEYVPETTFNFVKSKVYNRKRPQTAGMRDQIYTYEKGVVDAIFLRRFPQGQVWQVGDKLVFTCPTNTELMSGTYQQIFEPLFPKVKEPVMPAK